MNLLDVSLVGGVPGAEGGGILNSGTLTLERCQISDSTATVGGALANASGATVSVTASTLYGNSAENGGAIANQGTLAILNSTISGNTAATSGGGIDNPSGTLTITNGTIANNTAEIGGGLANSATATLLNTIIANNTATTDADFSGVVASLGTNLIGDVGTSTGWLTSDLTDKDPLLGPLQDNTGTTLTHALCNGSPAIDAAMDLGAPAEDQRGILRPQDVESVGCETTIIYSANMDTDPGWTLDAGQSPYQWEWGAPQGGGSNYGDPTAGHTGSNVIGYNLSGDYPNDLESPEYATTPAIDCTGYDVVSLSFYRWLGIESAAYDLAAIEVSNDGATWTSVWEHTAGDVSENEWSYQEYDISSVAADQATVYIRWRMGATDFSVTFPGWNIDDVTITGASTRFDIGATERFFR